MGHRTKILYVEDNPENVQLVRRVLEARGYEVIEADSGLKGAEAAKRERPDLILMDINLPEMDGYAAATLIKNTAELREIPIVALTASVRKGDRERTLAAGCDGYIPKPIDVRNFPAQVEGFLKGRREEVAPGEEKVYLKEHSAKLVERLEERIRELIEANQERQRNLDMLQERTNELSLLLEISTTVSSSLNLEEILQTSARIIAEKLVTTFCRIIVVNRERRLLILKAAYPQRDLDWDSETGRSCFIGESQSYKRIQKTGLPLLLREEEIQPDRFMPREWTLLTGNLAGLRSLLIAPVIRKGLDTGLLILGETRNWERSPFTPEKIRLCNAASEQMGSAIENAALYEEILGKTIQLKEANLDSIKALAAALETKDLETKGHSDRTVTHALKIAKKLGLSEQEQDRIQYAAILHDIGKIGIPEHILKKPGKLTPEEYEVMKKHPVYGAEIVRQIKFLEPVVPLVLSDHELWSGGGYPNDLKGEEIPLGARIVAVVDAYDAMTSDRVYRKALGKAHAISELKRCSGSQFDPYVVDVFLKILEEPS
jgi:putative nucleotidyltransferase with HDIG domain